MWQVPDVNPPTLQFARAARDGGIRAVAALDFSLAQAMTAPGADHGLSDEQLEGLKRLFALAMGEVIDRLINPAVRAFPELEPSQEIWAAVVLEQSKQIGMQAAAIRDGASGDPLLARRK